MSDAAGTQIHVMRRRLYEILEQAREEGAGGGPGAAAHVLDAADPAAVERVMREAALQSGPPDVLLNCVGGARPASFEEIDAERALRRETQQEALRSRTALATQQQCDSPTSNRATML